MRTGELRLGSVWNSVEKLAVRKGLRCPEVRSGSLAAPQHQIVMREWEEWPCQIAQLLLEVGAKG